MTHSWEGLWHLGQWGWAGGCAAEAGLRCGCRIQRTCSHISVLPTCIHLLRQLKEKDKCNVSDRDMNRCKVETCMCTSPQKLLSPVTSRCLEHVKWAEVPNQTIKFTTWRAIIFKLPFGWHPHFLLRHLGNFLQENLFQGQGHQDYVICGLQERRKAVRD